MKYCSVCSLPICEPSNLTITTGFHSGIQWCQGHMVSGYYYTITTGVSTAPNVVSYSTDRTINNALPAKREPVPDSFQRAFREGELRL
jgi:hypothetical protein